MWKLTRPDNRHDKLVRDNLLDLQDHRLVRIETVREDQRQVWVLTKRGHGEAKKLLEPRGIRVSALREAGTIGARSTPGGGRCFHCDGTGLARPLWEPAAGHA
ncbi:hypothetical protein [Streptomyces sp. NPDC003036]|uniref:hypothetical protein n=1 Tax=Streptomyces sp. NPDC003036 TaxID=3154442 RepID=UPI0033BD7F1F